MPLLLALPLALLVFLAILLMLLPLSLWQRFRSSGARRQARPWLVTFNLWGTLVSTSCSPSLRLLSASGGQAPGSTPRWAGWSGWRWARWDMH